MRTDRVGDGVWEDTSFFGLRAEVNIVVKAAKKRAFRGVWCSIHIFSRRRICCGEPGEEACHDAVSEQLLSLRWAHGLPLFARDHGKELLGDT